MEEAANTTNVYGFGGGGGRGTPGRDKATSRRMTQNELGWELQQLGLLASLTANYLTQRDSMALKPEEESPYPLRSVTVIIMPFCNHTPAPMFSLIGLVASTIAQSKCLKS